LPQTQPLFGNLLVLPQEGAQTGPTGRPPNSYALLLSGGRSVLFDAPYRRLLPALRQLAEEGYPPAALVLSHYHVAGQADAFEAFTGEEFDVPVFLHPADAKQVPGAGVAFADPTESALLGEAGLEVVRAPFHTEGSVMLYAERHGGVLLAGDGAAAPGPKQGLEPPRLERPPVESEAKDREQRQFWKDFAERPLRSFLPLHGATYTGHDDLPEIMRPFWEAE
jgi:glyoxylase-like metal-dependent hydrolase (beta-lactamase superfamily II)